MSSRPRRFLAPLALAVLLVTSACAQNIGVFTNFAPDGYLHHGPNAWGDHLQTTFDRSADPAVGRLVGPHFDVAMSGYSVTDRIEASQASGFGFAAGPIHANDGMEFFIAVFDTDGESEAGHTDESAAVSAVVVVDDVEMPLSTAPADGEMVVVVVPKDATVTLTITDEERPQTLGLRDGARTEQIDGYYTGKSESQDPADYSESGKATGIPNGNYEPAQRKLDLSFSVKSATRSPWVEERGWAKDGHVWLVVPIQDLRSNCVYGFELGSHQPMLYWEFNQDAVFNIVPNKGKESNAVGNQKFKANDKSKLVPLSATEVSFSPSSIDLIFQIPDDATSAKLKVTPQGKLKAAWSNVSGSGRWDSKPKTRNITIQF